MDAQPGLAGRGVGEEGTTPTHLLHTMAMTTTAMRKTRAAAEEPMMSGSFSWMLVWYSAEEKAQHGILSWLWESYGPMALWGLLGIQALFLLLRVPVTCSGGDLAVICSQVTLNKSMDCSGPQVLIYKMSMTPTSQCWCGNQKQTCGEAAMSSDFEARPPGFVPGQCHLPSVRVLVKCLTGTPLWPSFLIRKLGRITLSIS